MFLKNICIHDYFIKDHLDNVRMVLTDEQKTDFYPAATMETAQSATENQLYANVNTTRDDKPWGYPTDTYSSPNDKVAKVNGNGNKVGPAIILKVMAGDSYNLRVSSWYRTNGNSPGTPVNPVTSLVAALANGIAGINGNKYTTAYLQSGGVLDLGISNFLNSQSNITSRPKAYVSWVLFDEQFKQIGGGSEQVGDNDEFKIHDRTGLPVTKNGYLYIYVSNETPNIDVFFDNLQVTHTRGQLLEENHFYGFGLLMAGISSRSASIIANKEKTFQGQQFDDELGLSWVQFRYRNHDPQIGRFIEIDPLSEKFPYNGTYVFSENRVTNDIEFEGLETLRSFMLTLANSAGVGEQTDSKTFVKQVASTLKEPQTLGNAVNTIGEGVLGPLLVGIMSGGLGGNVTARTTINTGVQTEVATTEASLATRANQIQGTLSPATQSRTTTAVASATTSEGNATTLVASSEKNLRPAQIAALKPGEVPVSGVGHAETTILNHAAANGMQVNAVAASRPICAGCATAINNAGAVPASPLKITPMKPVVDATYVKPPILPPVKQ